MALAADWAWSVPNAHAVKAAGYDVALRYLSPDPTKNLSRGEAAALLAAKVGIGLVWESTADRAAWGAGAGAEDGHMAASQALALGFPAGAPLMANLGDFAASPAQIPAIDAYYLSFCAATAQWQHGGYATGYIIDQLVARGRTGVWWQNAMNDAGELGSVVSANAWIYQRTAHTVTMPDTPGSWWDENVIIRHADWWGSTPVPDPPPPVPPPVPPVPPPPVPVKAKEQTMILIHRVPGGQVALTDGVHKVYVSSPVTLANLLKIGVAEVDVAAADYDAIPNAS